jgi:hypothetical protein
VSETFSNRLLRPVDTAGDHGASGPDDEGCIKRTPHTRNLPVVPICRTPRALPCRANHNDASAHPAPIRGALRGRHERWSGMRWTRRVIRRMTVQADGEVVWSWRSDAGAKSWSAQSALWGDGGNQAWSPGRSRISRNTIVQGMPAVAVYPWLPTPVLFAAQAASGAARIRHSLHPPL